MNEIIIVGAGGHAKVVIDVIQTNKLFKIAGCIAPRNEQLPLDVPIIGDDSDLGRIYKSGIKLAFVAIGDNKKRLQAAQSMENIGYSFVNVIDKRSIVSRSTLLGNGVVVMPGSIINCDSRLSDHVIINTNSSIDHDCVIKRGAHIAPGSQITGGCMVGEGALVGAGSSLIPQVHVGDWSVVGAGSVVIRDVAEYTVSVGVPSKIIKKI